MNNIKNIINHTFYDIFIYVYLKYLHTCSNSINIIITICLHSMYKDTLYTFNAFLGYKNFNGSMLYE